MIVCLVIFCLLTMKFLLKSDQSILVNNFFSYNICDLPNRRYIVKSIVNVICDENSQKSFQFSMNSSSHICDQFETNLFSRLINDFEVFNKRKIVKEDIQNMSNICPNCHHIQIINNTLYHIPSKTAFDYESRSRSIKMALKFVTELFPNLPDVDLFFNVEDYINLPHHNDVLLNVPILGLAKTTKIKKGLRHENIILMPCFTLWSWPEVRVSKWSDKSNSIFNHGLTLKYQERTSKLFWRGIITWKRHWFANLSTKYPDLIDVKGMEWTKYTNSSILHGTHTYTSLEDHCNYKYLLHQEGNSYSSRIKYLLLCGSTVVYNRIEFWEEYWYHLLQHSKNIFLIQAKDKETIITQTLEYLQQHQQLAQTIGNQGRQLVRTYLNQYSINCYWWKLLNKYANLFRYKPILHSNAVPIDDFFLTN